MTGIQPSLRLTELLTTRDSSLALVVAALARIADAHGHAAFGELAIAYREEYLKLRAHTKGATAPEPGSLSVDDVRTHLGNSDRKSTRLNSSHSRASRMPSSA